MSVDPEKWLKRQSRKRTGGGKSPNGHHFSNNEQPPPTTHHTSGSSTSSKPTEPSNGSTSRASVASPTEPGEEHPQEKARVRRSASATGPESLAGHSSSDTFGSSARSSRRCCNCDAEFTRLLRPHKCRACRQPVCAPCSPARIPVPGSDDQYQRACKRCAGVSTPRVVAVVSPRTVAAPHAAAVSRRTGGSPPSVNPAVGSTTRVLVAVPPEVALKVGPFPKRGGDVAAGLGRGGMDVAGGNVGSYGAEECSIDTGGGEPPSTAPMSEESLRSGLKSPAVSPNETGRTLSEISPMRLAPDAPDSRSSSSAADGAARHLAEDRGGEVEGGPAAVGLADAGRVGGFSAGLSPPEPPLPEGADGAEAEALVGSAVEGVPEPSITREVSSGEMAMSDSDDELTMRELLTRRHGISNKTLLPGAPLDVEMDESLATAGDAPAEPVPVKRVLGSSKTAGGVEDVRVQGTAVETERESFSSGSVAEVNEKEHPDPAAPAPQFETSDFSSGLPGHRVIGERQGEEGHEGGRGSSAGVAEASEAARAREIHQPVEFGTAILEAAAAPKSDKESRVDGHRPEEVQEREKQPMGPSTRSPAGATQSHQGRQEGGFLVTEEGSTGGDSDGRQAADISSSPVSCAEGVDEGELQGGMIGHGKPRTTTAILGDAGADEIPRVDTAEGSVPAGDEGPPGALGKIGLATNGQGLEVASHSPRSTDTSLPSASQSSGMGRSNGAVEWDAGSVDGTGGNRDWWAAWNEFVRKFTSCCH